MKKVIMLITLLAMLTITGVAFAGNTYEISVDSSDYNVSNASLDVQVGDTITLNVYAAAGTGYQWETNVKPNNMLKQTAKNVTPVSIDKHISGGKMKWQYVYQVDENATGRIALHLVLVRAWEKNTKPAQEFALTLNVIK